MSDAMASLLETSVVLVTAAKPELVGINRLIRLFYCVVHIERFQKKKVPLLSSNYCHLKLQTPNTAGSNAIKASNFASFAAPSMGFITL